MQLVVLVVVAPKRKHKHGVALRFERLVEQARRVAPTQAITILDDALALWRGRAFGEFADEWWALPQATRWEELRIVASEERVDALVAQGAYDRAVADLEGLTLAYPLRERFVAQLMKAYDASGRQANALRAYAHYRDYLAEETGLEPSPVLHELEATTSKISEDQLFYCMQRGLSAEEATAGARPAASAHGAATRSTRSWVKGRSARCTGRRSRVSDARSRSR